MKKLALVVLLGCLSTGAMAELVTKGDYGLELRGNVNYYMLGREKSDLFRSAFGAEAQYRNWLSDPFGFNLALGMTKWDVEKDSTYFRLPTIQELDGSLTIIPIGGGVLYNPIISTRWSVVAELGLRYMLVNSDVQARDSERPTLEDIKIDDGLVALIVGDIEYKFTDQLSAFAGGGYQLDLMKASSSAWEGVDLRDVSFKGFIIRLGAQYAF